MTDEGAHAFAAALAGGRIEAPGAELVIAEWHDPGGATGGSPRYIAPLHVHREDDEAWYVLEGALVVRSGPDDITVPAGGAILVPRGVPHTYWNPLESPTRYLLVMTPRIAALIDALHGGPGVGGIEAAFAAHASEFLGWPT